MMPKFYVLLIALCGLSASLTLQAAADSRYVSDDLFTYTRTGGADNFRVAGTLLAGEEVTLLDVNNTTKFAQVRDAKGKVSWIPLAQLSTEPSFRTRVSTLEAQAKSLSEELNQIKNNWNSATADMQSEAEKNKQTISLLEQSNAQLTSELTAAKKSMNSMEQQLDEKQLDIALKWTLYGGAVAGGGLLLGLLLPYLIPRRRKDRWMN